jgi:hypothetical protein
VCVTAGALLVCVRDEREGVAHEGVREDERGVGGRQVDDRRLVGQEVPTVQPLRRSVVLELGRLLVRKGREADVHLDPEQIGGPRQQEGARQTGRDDREADHHRQLVMVRDPLAEAVVRALEKVLRGAAHAVEHLLSLAAATGRIVLDVLNIHVLEMIADAPVNRLALLTRHGIEARVPPLGETVGGLDRLDGTLELSSRLR